MGQYYEAAIKQQNAKNWNRFNSWNLNCSAKLCDHASQDSLYTVAMKVKLFHKPHLVVWAGDYADPEPGTEKCLYESARRGKLEYGKVIRRAQKLYPRMHYLVNHTKQVYFDYKLIEPDTLGIRLDPLPILTNESNGRGGGDYFGDNKEQAGIWARDLISIEETIPEGYTVFECPFKKFSNYC